MKLFLLISLLLFGMAAGALPAAAETLKGDFALCRSRAQLDQLLKAAVVDDLAVIDGLLAKGTCRATQVGQRVKIVGRGGAYVTVTLAGSKQRWVTVTEAVQR